MYTRPIAPRNEGKGKVYNPRLIKFRHGRPPPFGCRVTRSDRRGHPLDHSSHSPTTPLYSLLKKTLLGSLCWTPWPSLRAPGRLMPPPCAPILRPALTPPPPHAPIHRGHPPPRAQSALNRCGHGVHRHHHPGVTWRRLSSAGTSSLAVGRSKTPWQGRTHMMQIHVSSVSDVSKVCCNCSILMLQK